MRSCCGSARAHARRARRGCAAGRSSAGRAARRAVGTRIHWGVHPNGDDAIAPIKEETSVEKKKCTRSVVRAVEWVSRSVPARFWHAPVSARARARARARGRGLGRRDEGVLGADAGGAAGRRRADGAPPAAHAGAAQEAALQVPARRHQRGAARARRRAAAAATFFFWFALVGFSVRARAEGAGR